MNERTERRVLAAIVVIFVALAVSFSLGPIFEGPDEIGHYEYIRVLVKTRQFPDPNLPWSELHQAPLYYMLNAPLFALLDDSDYEQLNPTMNPYHGYETGIPSSDNKNIYLHNRAEAFPFTESPTALSIHILRLLSVLIGLGTLLTSYAIFHILWPSRPDLRLIATAAVAFLPEFVFMSSVLSNDTLLYLWATLSLFFLLRQEDGPTWRNATWLGLALGAALLTEISALFMVFPVGLAVITDRRRRYAVLTLLVTFAVAGWWYIRKWIIYGDPTGVRALEITQEVDAIAQGRPALEIGLQQMAFTIRGFFGRFAYGAIVLGDPLYRYFEFLTILALAGVAIQIGRMIARQKRPPGRVALRRGIIVAMFGVAWIAALYYWSSTVWTGNQGRFLMTSVACWGAMIAYGLAVFIPRQLGVHAALSLAALMVAVMVISLYGYFWPAYQVLPVPEAIAAQQPLYRYGDLAELIAVEPNDVRAQPGDVLTITLYWRALGTTDTRWQVYLHTVESDIVRRDSIPATGMLLATDWQPGDTWVERYVIRIPETDPQATHTLIAGLYDPQTETTLSATNAGGDTVTPVIGRLAIRGEAQPVEAAYCFADSISLAAPTVTRKGDTLNICLEWGARQTSPEPYQVFVHVLPEEGGDPLAQVDTAPKGGRYPTDVWQPGEAIAECIPVDIAQVTGDDWHIGLGLYRLSDGQRLEASVCGYDSALTVQDNMVILPAPAGP